MATVTYLCRRDPADDDHSVPYWFHHLELDLYASDPDLPSTDLSLQAHITVVHGNSNPSGDCLFNEGQSVRHENEEVISDIINGDIMEGRENQVNFLMDLFHVQQRVEQSQVMASVVGGGAVGVDLVAETLCDSSFGVIDGNDDGLDSDLGLGLGLGLGLHFGVERHCVEIEGSDGFFVAGSVSGAESGDASTVENCIRLAGFGSDSDEEENADFGIRLHPDDAYGLDDIHAHDCDDNDDDSSIPLCWDSLQLDDHREIVEDFEWEEIDARVDEREVLSTLSMEAENEGSVSASVSGLVAHEEEEVGSERGGFGTLEWEILLNNDNLEENPENEPYLGEHDYIYPAEYDMLFGQFAENETDMMGRPPASKTTVENLPSVVMTPTDMKDNNALCAVCKDEIGVGERAKQLPCTHRYHGDCIVPWLGIRNTCPVCRHELPTDDLEYERRKLQRAVRGR